MRSSADLLSVGLVVLSAFAGSAVANSCKTINSIAYCRPVDHITYTGISDSGSYNDVVHIDGKSCACNTKPLAYSGALEPLGGQISMHFRGPLALKKFAVYHPVGSKQGKRAEKRKAHFSQHYNKHLLHNHPHPHSITRPKKKKLSAGYQRTGYYDAASGIAQGIVFLNHMGGQGSGVFDKCFGNSLSYASSTCKSGSAKPQILADITLKSNTEFVIMTDEKCDGDCGYYRPGIPAYRGFDGKNKVFLFEFSMPADNGFGFNGNMPSIWALNAKIPRTVQYGKCSCWGSGCGEMDLFEVLKDATGYVKSHYHSNQGATGQYSKGGGGSPDYFKRPFDKTIKAAAIFRDNGSIIVRYLPDGCDFGVELDSLVLSAGQEPSVYRVPS